MDQLSRSTKRQDRTCILGSVSRTKAVAGDPLELLGVLHSTERVEMVLAPLASLLMMMRLKTIELSIGIRRERALIET
jgi:hypothetical protein